MDTKAFHKLFISLTYLISQKQLPQ